MNAIFSGDFGAALAPVAVLAVVNTCLVVAAVIAEHLNRTGSTVEQERLRERYRLW
jgi:hypothetical protein